MASSSELSDQQPIPTTATTVVGAGTVGSDAVGSVCSLLSREEQDERRRTTFEFFASLGSPRYFVAPMVGRSSGLMQPMVQRQY
jgi:hypothetical protein